MCSGRLSRSPIGCLLIAASLSSGSAAESSERELLTAAGKPAGLGVSGMCLTSCWTSLTSSDSRHAIDRPIVHSVGYFASVGKNFAGQNRAA